jgi:Anti-anti-sigma regulatory factor (antagonist of anti-sigma factor)
MKHDGTSHAAKSAGPLARCITSLIQGFFVANDDNSGRELNTEFSSTPAFRAEPARIGGEVLSVVGFAELTAANSNRFRKEVCAALNGHTVVEIDLSRTTTMDCAGLGALIALRNLARRRNGVVRLMNPTSRLTQLLDLMRAGEIFEIVNTRRTDDP